MAESRPSPQRPRDPYLPTIEAGRTADTALDPADVKRRLIQMGIITDLDWDEAIRRAGRNELFGIVSELQLMPARWDTFTSERYFLLTDYQAKQILSGKTKELRLKDHVVLSLLGEGGMGKVYKARNLKLPRIEAIKTISHEPHGSSMNASKTRANDRFRREAELLASLRHPCLPIIYGFDVWHDIAFIAMELVEGEDLDNFVQKKREGDEFVAVDWATEQIVKVADALKYVHTLKYKGSEGEMREGIIHRDIKPSNIMLTPGGEVRLLDLGIAKLAGVQGETKEKADMRLTSQGGPLGTPHFMAPEQWSDARNVTPAADIYSLGCTFYYLLTGELPFPASEMGPLLFAHMTAPRPKVSQWRRDVPAKLDAVIAKMMAPQPKDRYHNAGELIEALQPFLPSGATVTHGTSWPWKVGFATASLAVIAATIVILMQPTPQNSMPGIVGALTPVRQLIDKENYADAVVEATKVIDDNQSEGKVKAQAQFLRGIAALRVDPNSPTAVADLEAAEAAMRDDPDHEQYLNMLTNAYTQRAQSARDNSDLARLIDGFEAARRQQPKAIDSAHQALAFEAYHRLGAQKLKGGDYRQALEDFDAAIELDPKSAQVYADQAEAYTKLKKPTDAVASLGHAIELTPQDPKLYYQRGLAYAELREDSRSLENFEEAIRLKLDAPDVYVRRGEIYARDGRLDLAAKDFRSARLLDASNAEASRLLAQADLQLAERALKEKSFDSAIKSLEEAASVDPANRKDYTAKLVAAYSLAGDQKLEDARYEDATKYFSEAMRLDKANADQYAKRSALAYLDWAKDFRAADKKTEAIAKSTTALQLAPDDPLRAAAYYQRGLAEVPDYEKAIVDFGRAVELDDRAEHRAELENAFTARARQLLNNASHELAIKNYEEAKAKNAVDAAHVELAAQAYFTKGNASKEAKPQEAIKDYETAIALRPKYAEARAQLVAAFASLSKFEDATSDVDKTVALLGQSSKVYRDQVARAYLDWGKAVFAAKKEYAKAREKYELGLKLEPSAPLSGQLYFAQGMAYADEKNYQKAQESFLNAMQYDEENVAYQQKNTEMAGLLAKDGKSPLSVGAMSRASAEAAKITAETAAKQLGEKKFDLAASNFEKAAASDPANAQQYRINAGKAYAQWAGALLSDGNFQEALVKFEQAGGYDKANAAAYSKASAKAYIGLGDELAMQNKFESAIEKYSSAVSRDETSAEALAKRGAARVDQLLYSSGVDDLLKAASLASGAEIEAYKKQAADAYVRWGAVASNQGLSPDALKRFSEAIKLDPTSVKAFDERADTQLRLGDTSAAIEDYSSAAQLDPDNKAMYADKIAKIHFGLAEAAYKDGKYPEAIKHASDAIAAKPEDPQAFYKRALANVQLDKFDAAEGDYKKAKELAPNGKFPNPIGPALAMKAEVAKSSGDLLTAVGFLEKAVDKDPQNAADYKKQLVTDYATLGSEVYKKQKYDEAIENFTRAIGFDPNHALSITSRGTAYYMKGDYQKAAEDYSKAIQLNDKDMIATKYRGLIYLMVLRDHYKQGIADLLKADAMKALDNDDMANNYLASAFIYASDKSVRDGAKAVKYAKEAVRLKSANAEYVFTLASAYHLAEDYENAAKTLDEAIKLAPEAKKKEYELLRPFIQNKQPLP